MCIFDILGNVYVNNDDTRVSRYENMLVLELIDTTVIVFRVKRKLFNRYDLYIMDTKVFTVYCNKTRITFGYHREGRLGVRYDMYVGRDYLGGRIVAGSRVTAGDRVFLENDLRDWARTSGVVLPSCCIYTISDDIVEHECSLVRRKNMFIIKFPNGMVFPVLIVDDELRIACTSVECEAINFITLSVRVVECRDNYVRFRVVVIDGWRTTTLDDIVYDSSGVCYADKVLSARQIAKHLLLG